MMFKKRKPETVVGTPYYSVLIGKAKEKMHGYIEALAERGEMSKMDVEPVFRQLLEFASRWEFGLSTGYRIRGGITNKDFWDSAQLLEPGMPFLKEGPKKEIVGAIRSVTGGEGSITGCSLSPGNVGEIAALWGDLVQGTLVGEKKSIGAIVRANLGIPRAYPGRRAVEETWKQWQA